MIARGLLTIALSAGLALVLATSSHAALRPCGAAIAGDVGARIAVKGWDCSAGQEVFAAWSSLVRQADRTPATAPRRMEVGGIGCRKRTAPRRVTVRCANDGNVMRARWKR